MKTLAPGKVVLSGAYSVLESAPAIVTAIDRNVVVDTTRPGSFLTEEVRAAGFSEPYWFDASALRSDGRKLGLGSSAAILLATMAAKELLLSPQLHCERLREKLFLPALAAHRLAQGGGSGLDVACSCFGGTLAFYLGEHEPKIAPVRLPRGLTVEVWSSLVESSTKGLLARVRALRQNNAIQYRTAMDAQARAAEAALSACRADDASGFLAALDAQRRALSTLGSAASAPIVTAEVENLAQKAEKLGAVVLPSGAGGGDIAIYVGFAPSHDLDAELCAQKHERLAGQLGADGVRRFD